MQLAKENMCNTHTSIHRRMMDIPVIWPLNIPYFEMKAWGMIEGGNNLVLSK